MNIWIAETAKFVAMLALFAVMILAAVAMGA
jgi:hypothetical protein